MDPHEIGNLEMGEVLFYESQTRCIGCHTLDGGTYRPGPTLLGISEIAGDRMPDLSAVECLRQSILNPQAYVVEGFEDTEAPMHIYTNAEPDENGRMDKFTLTEEELNSLIAFMLTHDKEE